MKVLIVNRYMSIYGGAEIVVKELSTNLTRLGIENLVITLNISQKVKEICAGVKFILPPKYFPYAFRSVNLISALGIFEEIFWLRKLVKQYVSGFDIINVHNFPANWVVYNLNKPVVWMCNEPPDLVNNPSPSLAMKFIRWAGILVDRYLVNKFIDEICVADELNAERVRQRYHRESVKIPYGIDTELFNKIEFDKTQLRKKYNISEKDFVLLQVGVVSPQKNQIESIKSLKTLLENNYQAKLILTGRDDGPYKQILQEYIRKNQLSDKVIFTGQIDRTEVAKLYHLADICLFPVKEQGGWLAPFEALSCGVPVIVSSTMGAASLIREHNFGIVTNNFTDAIIELKNSYSKYKNIAEKASEWIKVNLTWEKFTQRMVSVFEEILKRRRYKN